jgi:hypothetical protein
MLCLTNRIEDAQNDPRASISDEASRHTIVSYGNRLFCDAHRGELIHPWGSKKLYRQYFVDYRTFLKRPELVAAELNGGDEKAIAIVQADLSKFFDRVRPVALHKAIEKFRLREKEVPFFTFAGRLFNWTWSDSKRAKSYASKNGIEGFDKIALPQGLVASGFFANVFLSAFDQELKRALHHAISPGIILKDACRYVDDMRFVVEVPRDISEEDLQERTTVWLEKLLRLTAPGLEIQRKKTKAVVLGREQRFMVPQSKAAERLQREVSGPFDVQHGTEIIGALEGFFHTQQRFASAQEEVENSEALLLGVPDMRDETAARFAASRYRRMYRLLRPMLLEAGGQSLNDEDDDAAEEAVPAKISISRDELDERAKVFAAMLVEAWVTDPSNVRLLRIGLDLFPHPEFLNRVLGLLDRIRSHSKREHREIGTYCLAELFRAGATETGAVQDPDSLPAESDRKAYHEALLKKGLQLIGGVRNGKPTPRLPWYLLQQVSLYLATRGWPVEADAPIRLSERGPMRRYWALRNFILGYPAKTARRDAMLSILCITAFDRKPDFESWDSDRLSPDFFEHAQRIAPRIASELYDAFGAGSLPGHSALEVLRRSSAVPFETETRSVAAWSNTDDNPFLEEENVLLLADFAFRRQTKHPTDVALSPWRITATRRRMVGNTPYPRLEPEGFKYHNRTTDLDFLFTAPDWCTPPERIRVEIGQLLCAAIRGPLDALRRPVSVQQNSDSRVPRYRAPMSHWEQLRYGSFAGREALGPSWLPASSWLESFLFRLLRWPGIGENRADSSPKKLHKEVRTRLRRHKRERGKASEVLFLEQEAPPATKPRTKNWERPLRLAVAQTVIPSVEHFAAAAGDPELNSSTIRIKHRRHLAAMLEALAQTLRARETHRTLTRKDGQTLDWLVLPELAVHPADVDALLIPFVRRYHCMVFAGLVFHPKAGTPSTLINSAIWLIPEWSPVHGLRIRKLEQGKKHLAKLEQGFSPPLQGFRPTQWIINYRWSSKSNLPPLRLSGAVCYDATDLQLVSDLKGRNDLFAICALNPDVGTFDRMAEALNYHMFQGVLIANNGTFGGSNFFVPFANPFHRQVFHLHGQPQATFAFAEISPEKFLLRGKRRRSLKGRAGSSGPAILYPEGEWKSAPANWP